MTTGLADIVPEQALMLGAGSTVFYQLAERGVGLGVAEHSTTLRRPIDRLRTTLSYVYVMALGTDEERRTVARLVNRAHVPVRSEGRYSAFDPALQLWVAATLARNGIVITERIWGPLDPASRRRIYQEAQVFGTALQVRPEQWPATLEEFEAYWDSTVAAFEPEPSVQAYCRELLGRRSKPPGLRWLTPLQSLVDRGALDPHTRAVLGMSWSARDQRRFDLFWRVLPPVYRRVPRPLRHLQARLVLRDVRRRLRTGRHLI